MPDDTFTVRVDADLKAAFAEAAAAEERTAAQLLRHLMRGAVEARDRDRAHDAWFRGEVADALAEAVDPTTALLSHEEVRDEWDARRRAIEERAAGRTA